MRPNASNVEQLMLRTSATVRRSTCNYHGPLLRCALPSQVDLRYLLLPLVISTISRTGKHG
jgi:hypothetical protein